jgi:predicted metal-dependent hydrolase
VSQTPVETGEKSEIQFGRTTIGYAIRRSARRRTVSITVDPREEVVLLAPIGIPVDRLDRVVHRKARWIVGKLRRGSNLPTPLPPREFVSGETFRYLGRQYRLRVASEASGRPSVSLRGGWLRVGVPRGTEGPERAAAVQQALVGWYRLHAAERLPERVAVWSLKLGIPMPMVLIREQTKRWASCDRKRVMRFNWRIIQAAMTLVDYVVVHELVHLSHREHTWEFWSTLGKAMPDYEHRRASLKHLGPDLNW